MYICSMCQSEVKKAVHTEGMDPISWNGFYADKTGDICLKCFMEHSGVNTLYHLSLEPGHIDLYPRVPRVRKHGEDGKIKRISVSNTIEGCLSAVPWGGVNLEEIFNEDESALIRVYEFEVDDVGIENIVPPDYLFQTDKVRDAYENGEHWITKSVEPSKTYLIKLLEFEEDNADDYSYEEMLRYQRDMNDWEDPGSYGIIDEIEYEFVPEGSFSRYFDVNYKIVQHGDSFDLSDPEEAKRWKETVIRNINLSYPSDYVFFDGKIERIEDSRDEFILFGTIIFENIAFDSRNVLNTLRKGLVYADIVEEAQIEMAK